MRHSSLLFALTIALVLHARVPAQQATPADPNVQRAKLVVTQLVAGEFAKVFADFDTTMQTALPEKQLAETWKTVVTQAGAFRAAREPRLLRQASLMIVIVPCDFEKAALDINIVFDGAGKIAGLSVRPAAAPEVAYTPPAYAVPANFTEEPATVGAAPFVLPATLSMPVGPGPFPAVVLVHGSGPNDRDETILANKPFRDLALGLASRGVAVLRYEKRTREHAARSAAIPGFTVKDETIDDAVAAAAVLRRTPRVDPARVVILGHSLGGMLIPRIAAAASSAAGFIVMAGAARPLEQALVEQTRYIVGLSGPMTPAGQKAIDDADAIAVAVRKLTEADRANPALISNAPASYWLDLRGYDPPAAARAITRPMLVLQGERDYQVTMAEFARWKTALDGRPRVTFKSYPTLNHLFIAGDGPSTPTEYRRAGHVDEAVVRDIAAWVVGVGRG